MRYIVNSKNYVTEISFGSPLVVNDCECTEYTGSVPSGYNSLEEWYLEEELTLWRWKIVNGNLTLDSTAKAPEEGQWGVPELQSKTVHPATSEQIVTADSEYDGLEKVTVEKMNLEWRYVAPSPFNQHIERGNNFDGLSGVTVYGASLYEEQAVSVSSDKKSISFSLSRNDTFPEKIIVYSDFHSVNESSNNIVLLELFLYRYRVDYVQTFWVRYRDADNYMDYDGIGYDTYTETLEALGLTLTKNGYQYTLTISDSKNLTFNNRATLTAHVAWMNENQ